MTTPTLKQWQRRALKAEAERDRLREALEKLLGSVEGLQLHSEQQARQALEFLEAQ